MTDKFIRLGSKLFNVADIVSVVPVTWPILRLEGQDAAVSYVLMRGQKDGYVVPESTEDIALVLDADWVESEEYGY